MNTVETWISVLACYVVAYRRPIKAKALAGHLEVLIPSAKDIFRELKSLKQTQLNAVSTIKADEAAGRNGMPSLKYTQQLLAIRKEMNKAALTSLLNNSKKNSPYLVTKSQQKLVKNLLEMLNPNPATIERKDTLLDKQIAIIPDRLVRLWMIPEIVNEQPHHIAEIKHIIKKHFKRDDIYLTKEEGIDLKAANPDRKKRYDQLHRLLTKTWQDYVRAYIREKGHHLTIQEVADYLHDENVTHNPLDHLIASGMGDFKLDENSAPYSPDDRKLTAVSLPSVHADVKVNTNYTPQGDMWIYKFKEKYSQFYTPVQRADSKAASKEAGTDRMMEHIPIVPTKRPLWIEDLMGTDPLKRILGAILEITWELAPRVGSKQNAEREVNPSQGLSTLTPRHITINGNVLTLQYPGKSHQIQTHVLNAKTPEHMRVLKIVKEQLRGKGKDDWVWTNPEKDNKLITGSIINDYIRKDLGMNITHHEFRDIRGTMEMVNAIKKAKIPKDISREDLEAKLKELAVNVGTLLGHYRKGGEVIDFKTAVESYFVTKVIADPFKSRGYVVPEWVPEQGRGEGLSEEIQENRKNVIPKGHGHGSSPRLPRTTSRIPRHIGDEEQPLTTRRVIRQAPIRPNRFIEEDEEEPVVTRRPVRPVRQVEIPRSSRLREDDTPAVTRPRPVNRVEPSRPAKPAKPRKRDETDDFTDGFF